MRVHQFVLQALDGILQKDRDQKFFLGVSEVVKIPRTPF